MQLTKNFTYEELTRSNDAKRLGIDNTPDKYAKDRLAKLAQLLQKIRDKWGKPIVVTSGYRCPKLNRAVGGASTSDHMYGRAADITTLSDTVADNKKLFTLIYSMVESKEIEVKQLIDEYGYNWIHVSFQDGSTSKRNQILHLK